MKRWMKWALLALLLGLLASGVWRALSSRQAQQEGVARMAADRSQTIVELGALDVIEVKSRDMAMGLAISGALKAVNSAIVKARVAGELQDLTVREGDTVKAGQIVARVDPTEYQARVRQAQQLAESAHWSIRASSPGRHSTPRWPAWPPPRPAIGPRRPAWRSQPRRWTTPFCARRWPVWFRSAWRSQVNVWHRKRGLSRSSI
jgi:hypothetical protein